MARIGSEQRLAKRKRLPNQAPKKARIPGEISLQHYAEIDALLRKVLTEMNAMQVVARLNTTGIEEPAPVFIGWVENRLRANLRMQKNDSHPALLRAGDTDPSTSYELCFRHGSIERDWKNLGHVQERKSNELCLSQKTGVNYLRIMRIEVHQDGKQPRGVGVLGAGFEARPDDCGKVDEILRRWAQSDKSEFVDYLEEHFQLGGPILKS